MKFINQFELHPIFMVKQQIALGPQKARYYYIIHINLCVKILTVMSDNEKIDQHILSKFQVIKKLGSGAYGHVWKVAPLQKPNQIYALKKVFEAFQHDTDAQRTYRQVSLLKKLEHENIIKIFEVYPSESGRDIYIVFEFMNTDLYRTIYQGSLQDIHKKYVLYQLLKGLHYLHSAHILHRDLKPSNLLLTTQCQLKICDFGLARHLNHYGKEQNVLTEGVATRWYRAPQVLLGSNSYNQKADIWSVGCIFAEMLMKVPLFNCNSIVSQFQKILQLVGRPTNDQLNQVGEVAACLLQQCGQIRQKSTKQIFGSVNDEQTLDLLLKLLKFDPRKRPSARQALRHPYFKEFYREEELKTFKGTIVMEADDNVKLTTQAYKQLIRQYFMVNSSQPQRFCDLKGDSRRDKSFGKIIEQIHSRKSSCSKDKAEKNSRRNNSLFEQLINERSNSRPSSSILKSGSISKSRTKSNANLNYNELDKENMSMNRAPNLQKFTAKAPTGTFAALRKVTAVKFNRP